MEAIKQFPEEFNRLETVTEEIRSGTTAVVALILNNKLYVANVGMFLPLLLYFSSIEIDELGFIKLFHNFRKKRKRV